MTVAILGLGPMGRGIAVNLARAGSRPRVWNRTRAAADAIRREHLRIVDAPADAVAENILSVLPDVDQFRAITGPETWDAWARSGVRRVIVMSTTSPEKVADLERDLAEHGIRVADAPMSGGETGAEAGSLSLMVGARDDDWPHVRDTLEPAASRIEWFGEPGAGSIAKLCNQVVVAGTLTSLAEAFALAERTGLDLEALRRVLENGLASSAVLTAKGDRLVTGDFTPSGSAVNQLKDLRYVAALASAVGAVMPVSSAITPLFSALVDAGKGHLDHSVVLETLREPR